MVVLGFAIYLHRDRPKRTATEIPGRTGGQHYAQRMSTTDTVWNDLSGELDEVVARLSKSHQQAVLLRFYENKTFDEVAAVLGISEGAARKRVQRAVESLSSMFRKQDIHWKSGAIDAAILSHVTLSGAGASAASVASAALSATSGTSAAIAKTVSGMFAYAQAKSAAILIAATAALVAATIAVVIIFAKIGIRTARAQTTIPAPIAATLPATTAPAPTTSSAPIAGGQQIYSANDLLVKNAQSRLWLQRIAMKVDIDTESQTTGPRASPVRKGQTQFAFYRSKDQYCCFWTGVHLAQTPGGNVDRANSDEFSDIQSPAMEINGLKIGTNRRQMASFQTRSMDPISFWYSLGYGFEIDGYLLAGQPIEKSLDASHIHPTPENIQGHVCYVIESSMHPGGTAILWICPDEGYLALRMELLLQPSKVVPEHTVVVDQMKVAKMGNQYVPTDGRLRHTLKFADGSVQTVTYFIHRQDVDLNPDFEKLRVFVPQFPPGTIITSPESPGVQYKLQDEKIVPSVPTTTIGSRRN